MSSRSVSLTDELDRFVDGKVESGKYNNASEVVRESLRLLMEHEAWVAEARASIERGWQQAKAGQLVEGKEAFRLAKERIAAVAAKRRTRA